jgi:probable F420-dependent oxidoreductase
LKVTCAIPIDIVDPVEFQNAAAAREMAQALEKAGVDACYITDHPAPTGRWRDAGGHDALDPFTGLAFVAAATTKLKLHTNLVVLPYRNPFVIAKAVATLDVFSEGRVILGIGVGYMKAEYLALGADFEGRGAVMDDTLETMKLAWSEGEVTREGRGYVANGIRPRPLPVQKPHPVIWHGGNSARAISRAARLCDGWTPFYATGPLSKTTRTEDLADIDDLKVKIGHLKEELAKAGRTRPFDIVIGPQGGLKGRTAADVDQFVNACGELSRLGVNWVPMGAPHPDRKTWLEHVQWLGEDVMPKLKAVG